MHHQAIMATAIALTLGTTTLALAGQGAGPGNGTGPIHELSTASCEIITGTVASAAVAGEGYVIDTGVETVNVFGLGPIGYWDRLELVPPQVGESITVDICWLSFSDETTKAIATAITLMDGTYVELRDPITNQPSWRGGQGGGQGQGQAGGQGQGLADCTGPR
ncbi:MAG: hypothetical protein VBE63_00535 [Lamprobacter sp.]|uniref:hypothetical protein n=1 Tax=Lamprobacter sp. TaxID=3100796 RepID=UPI002B262ECA|nr:hypothetical protein [Lamprobacter sp.]MEA3638411.1 hypothetical protein [Lamprobacter sp.]